MLGSLPHHIQVTPHTSITTMPASPPSVSTRHTNHCHPFIATVTTTIRARVWSEFCSSMCFLRDWSISSFWLSFSVFSLRPHSPPCSSFSCLFFISRLFIIFVRAFSGHLVLVGLAPGWTCVLPPHPLFSPPPCTSSCLTFLSLFSSFILFIFTLHSSPSSRLSFHFFSYPSSLLDNSSLSLLPAPPSPSPPPRAFPLLSPLSPSRSLEQLVLLVWPNYNLPVSLSAQLFPCFGLSRLLLFWFRCF